MSIALSSSKESNPQEIILPTNDHWQENFFSLVCLANKIFGGNDISKAIDSIEKDKNTINYQSLPFEMFLMNRNAETEINDFNELKQCFDDNNRKCKITIKQKQNINNNPVENVSTDININNNNNNNSFLKYFLITTSSGGSQTSFKWVPSFMTDNLDNGASEMKSSENDCDWDEELNSLKNKIYNKYHLHNAPKLEIKIGDENVEYGNELEDFWEDINDKFKSQQEEKECHLIVIVSWASDNSDAKIERELMNVGYRLRSIKQVFKNKINDNPNSASLGNDIFGALKSLKDEIVGIANGDEYDESALTDCLSEFSKWMSFVGKEPLRCVSPFVILTCFLFVLFFCATTTPFFFSFLLTCLFVFCFLLWCWEWSCQGGHSGTVFENMGILCNQ